MIVSVNQSAERIFGWPSNEMIGQSVECLMPQQRREHARQLYSASHGADKSSSIVGQEREIKALHKDGHQFPATIAVTQVMLDNQHMIIGSCR